MALRVTCPSCQDTFKVDDKYGGKKIRCRACEHPIRLPMPKSRKDDSDEYKVKKKGSPLPIQPILKGLVGVVLVAVVAGAIWQFLVNRPRIPLPKLPDPAPSQPSPPPVTASSSKPVEPPGEPAWITRVKKSTVGVIAKSGDKISEGSGFFAVLPGHVITNAHVLGIGKVADKAPRTVDLVLYKDQPSETKYPGVVLGVDRPSNLALIRVHAESLPPPLSLAESVESLQASQKVFTFGMPGEEDTAKGVTYAETSIVGFGKHEETGATTQIQVSNGIHTKNSGGPLTNADGTVYGVAAAPDTPLYAIPANFIKLLLQGTATSLRLGIPYRTSVDTLQVNATFTLLDPQEKLVNLRAEVWVGNPGPTRPGSLTPPSRLDGDSDPDSFDLDLLKGIARGNLTLPNLPAGKVYWARPIFNANMIWGPAFSFKLDAKPLEPKDVLLQYALVGQAANSDRLVKMVSDEGQIEYGQARNSYLSHIEANIETQFRPSKDFVHVKFYPVSVAANTVKPAGPVVYRPGVLASLPHKRATYQLNPNGKVFGREISNAIPVASEFAAEVDFIANQIFETYTAACTYLPNRKVTVGESWESTIEFSVPFMTTPQNFDAKLTNTYIGMRGNEAFVQINGAIVNQSQGVKIVTGYTEGLLRFDVIKKIPVQVKQTLTLELLALDGRLAVDFARNFDVMQSAAKIFGPDPLPPIPGKVLQEGASQVTDTSPLDPGGPPGSRRMVNVITLKGPAGYVVDVLQDGSMWDPYLRIESASGQILAQDNDSGGGRNPRAYFVAPVTGNYSMIIGGNGPTHSGRYILRITQVK